MKTNCKKSDDTISIENIFANKVVSSPKFTKQERNAISTLHKNHIDHLWKKNLKGLANKLQPQVDLLHAAEKDKSLKKYIEDQSKQFNRARTEQPEFFGAQKAVANANFSCDGYLASPPYTSGNPISEEIGENAIPLSGTTNLKTFSELALPNEGSISIGTAHGQFFETTIHPPSFEFLFLKGNTAEANLECFLPCIPGAPRAQRTQTTVTIDVKVGNPAKGFLYLVPGEHLEIAMGLVGVQGEIFLTAYGSQSMAPHVTSKEFLFFQENFAGIVPGSRDPLANFSLSNTFDMIAGASWIAIEIDVRIMAFSTSGLGPIEEHKGFSGIDLRSPNHNTHQLWLFQEPAGPIKIPNISMTFCPIQEAI